MRNLTIWVDVEDLFDYARGSPRPSGIQRLAFEIGRVLQALDGEAVRFVRHDPVRNGLVIVPWSAVAALFARLTEDRDPPPPAAIAAVADASGEIRPHSPARQFVRTLVHRLPASLRSRLIEAMLAEEQAMRAWGRLALWLGRRAVQGSGGPPGGEPMSTGAVPPAASFADLAAPGDVLLTLGSAWAHPDYAAFVRLQQERHGLRFALLIYDLIPLRRPEWCDRGLVRLFRAWFEGVLPIADHLFAISRATAADVEAYAREHGIALPGRVEPLPIGTGFGGPSAATPATTERLPAPGSYVLVVSTIEARKNHLLAFRVWRRLLEESPADAVPTLVFAGRVGWLVDDLMRQIANTDNLDGKLVLVLDPTDAELTALYRGCLFTLYPSFFEGWGLPVTESLAFGKPCVTSNRTALPEAGGSLARQFDPDDLNDAYALIADTIRDRTGLAEWEARIRREFEPVPWAATAEALLAGLGHPLAISRPAPGDLPTRPRPASPPVPAS